MIVAADTTEWISAIGGVAAVFVALGALWLELWRNNRSRQEAMAEQLRSVARKVAAWVEDWSSPVLFSDEPVVVVLKVRLVNGGDEAVFDVDALITVNNGRFSRDVDLALGVLGPNDSGSVSHEIELADGIDRDNASAVLGSLFFTDGSGRRWRRRGDGRLALLVDADDRWEGGERAR